jgi:hypothetical protein
MLAEYPVPDDDPCMGMASTRLGIADAILLEAEVEPCSCSLGTSVKSFVSQLYQ